MIQNFFKGFAKGINSINKVVSATDVMGKGFKANAESVAKKIKSQGMISGALNPLYNIAQGGYGYRATGKYADAYKLAYADEKTVGKVMDLMQGTGAYAGKGYHAALQAGEGHALYEEARGAFDDIMKNAVYDKKRMITHGIIGAGTGYRLITGGGVYRDHNGQVNIPVIPGI